MEQHKNVKRAALNPETLEKSFAFILNLLRDVGANTTDVDALISESQGLSVSSTNVLERQTETCLNSEPALTVLNIGFPLDRVKSAIRKKIERTGLGFSSSNDLIDAILNALQEETTSLNVIYKLY